MTKRLIQLVLGMGLLLFPTLVSAHNQPGPPYLEVNGVYAETNPVSGISPGQIAQDQIKTAFVVGQSINFVVDQSRIGVPGQYRWQWTPDMTGYQDGDNLMHSFDKPGSYTVTLQADNQFTGYVWADYDTVQIDVVPYAGYERPGVKVYVHGSQQSNGNLAQMAAYDTHDKKAQITDYHWLYGDGTEGSGAKTTHLYDKQSVRVFPAVFVRDDNGLLGYAVFEIDQENSTFKPLELSFFPGTLLPHPPAFQLTRLEEELGGAVIIVGIGVFIWKRPKKRATAKKPAKKRS